MSGRRRDPAQPVHENAIILIHSSVAVAMSLAQCYDRSGCGRRETNMKITLANLHSSPARTPRALCFAGLIAATLIAAGCAMGPTYPAAPRTAAGDYDYVIGPLDTVNIIVWQSVLEKQRAAALGSTLLAVYGVWQCVGEVRPSPVRPRWESDNPTLTRLRTLRQARAECCRNVARAHAAYDARVRRPTRELTRRKRRGSDRPDRCQQPRGKPCQLCQQAGRSASVS